LTSFRAAGAVGVTVPTCWYLLSNAPNTSHGHDDHGDSHGAAHDEKHEEPKEEEGEKSEDPEGKEEESEKSEDSDSEDEKKDTDTPDNSDDEGGDDDKNTKTTIPDAKGGIKKRSESKNAIKAGENGDEVSRGQCLA
jgi:hypothetical protein